MLQLRLPAAYAAGASSTAAGAASFLSFLFFCIHMKRGGAGPSISNSRGAQHGTAAGRAARQRGMRHRTMTSVLRCL